MKTILDSLNQLHYYKLMLRKMYQTGTCKYRFMNQINEYWYIGSIFASSDIQKKRTAECVETGIYIFRVWSISFSVTAATSCLA